MTRPQKASLTLVLALTLHATGQTQSTTPPERWWGAAVEASLTRAGKAAESWRKALSTVAEKHRAGISFLLQHGPSRDLQELTPAFLIEHVELAYRAREEMPWGRSIPEDIFLNDVLPHAHVSEARDPWRRDLYDICARFVKGCKTPGEAAQRLNEKVFPHFGVKYSTKRRAPDQGTAETCRTKMASCTGLSILLASACRTVCVPARLAGIASWVNKRGNHTWVEVWDQGWHFTGAAEPDPKGLNHSWFQRDAALAKSDVPRHAIHAVSYRRTDVRFPMVWSRSDRVSAVNVTERYTRSREEVARPHVHLEAWAGDERVRAAVRVLPWGSADELLFQGKTPGNRADLNDFLTFTPESVVELRIEARFGNAVHVRQMSIPETGDVRVRFDFERVSRGLDEDALVKELASLLSGAEDEPSEELENLLAQDDARFRGLALKAFRVSGEAGASQMKKDFDEKQVRHGEHLSPYTVRRVGQKPEGGWPLFIAMHGGGGVPKRVNDSQWRIMQRYYKDQEGLGYLYLALRAPNDRWNGFYDHYVYPLIENLAQQFVLFGDVDPDRVYLMGYSHGGYGAFAIGPKIPDRFAAVHSSAAAPTDGQSSAKNLRNTVFTFMIGERDRAYGRIDRCRAFDREIQALKKASPGEYPVTMEFIANHGHGGLPDRDKIRSMIEHERTPCPRKVTWHLTDGRIRHHFWLGVEKPEAGLVIDASCRENEVTVQTNRSCELTLTLDARLVDVSRPVLLRVNGALREPVQVRPAVMTFVSGVRERGDVHLAGSATVKVICDVE